MEKPPLLDKNKIEKLLRCDDFVPIYTPRSAYNNLLEFDEKLLNELTLNFDPFTI